MNNVITVNEGVMAGDVFYGNFRQNDNTGKLVKVMVSNHCKPDKKYKFRYVLKCKAGFLHIVEQDAMQTAKEFIQSTVKFLDNVQVYIEGENGTGNWHNVLATKGKKFYSIDKEFLLNLKVRHIHSAWKKMVDYNLWDRMNAKNWDCYAYRVNEAQEEAA